MMDNSSLDFLFHPRSIAIAGVSDDSARSNSGLGFMRALISSGFRGKIYPVNPDGGEISGSKIYPSIRDIPDTVDYVISAIPARYTPQLVTDCAAKGVRAIHFFTAGFSEIEDDEGEQLQSEILRIAHQGGIRIIGPNCLGLYCPATGLSFAMDLPEQSGFPKQSGPVGLISQSGGNSIYCVKEAATRGVYFSKVISYGNASDLDETDFLDYLADDPETGIIAAYIEGIKDGSRFIRALKRAARAKPVIIFKVGATETGRRAAASHTSAIAGSDRIWAGLLKQAGAIQVHSVEEMVDVVLAFLRISVPKGRSTALVGVGGGASVKAGDDCSNAGLVLPMLPLQVRQRLRDIFATEAGCIFRNPVDLVPLRASGMLVKALKAIADCDEVDLLIIHVAFDVCGMIDQREITRPYTESVLELNKVVNKPMAVVLHCLATDEGRRFASEARLRLREAGVAVYPSIEGAANAFNKLIRYHRWHEGSQEDAS